MAEIDFQKMLDSMSVGGNSNDAIKSIYGIIPCYDSIQQHLLFQAFYFINKYDLGDMRGMFQDFDKVMKENKNLSFMGSQNLKQLLAAYTQNEYLRGIKIQTTNDISEGK